MYRNKQAGPISFKLGFLFLITISVLMLQGCDKAPIEEKQVIRPIRAMEVSDVTQFRQRQFPGIAKATQEVDLAFRVSGPLTEFPVNVGDVVSKNDMVARIDPRDYQVQVNNARGQLDRAKAKVKRAEADYNREMKILSEDAGATSMAAVERKEALKDQARADVQSVQASLTSAKDSLSYTYLRAPFDGVVVSTYVENFEDVQAKKPIVRIVDDSSIEMIINIPESLISYVLQATNIEVVFDPFPTIKVAAEIKEIGTEASKSTRTYPVTLIMAQPSDVKILPGMAGKATGESSTPDTQQLDVGIQVPLTAIFSPDDIDKTYVWIIDKKSNQVTKREVTIGALKDSGIIVTQGLNTGEWIAIAGVHYLREGMDVKILEERAE
jgi:membrane fusion protein, multidrug efflux system